MTRIRASDSTVYVICAFLDNQQEFVAAFRQIEVIASIRRFFASVTPSSTAGVAGSIYFQPIWIGQPITIEGEASKITTAYAGSGTCTNSWGVAIYANSGNRPTGAPLAYGYSSNLNTGNLTVTFTNCTAVTGISSCAISPSVSFLAPGWYWMAFQYGDTTMCVGTPATSALNIDAGIWMGTSTLANIASNNFYLQGVSVTGTPGTFTTNPLSFTEYAASNGIIPWMAIELASVP